MSNKGKERSFSRRTRNPRISAPVAGALFFLVQMGPFLVGVEGEMINNLGRLKDNDAGIESVDATGSSMGKRERLFDLQHPVGMTVPMGHYVVDRFEAYWAVLLPLGDEEQDWEDDRSVDVLRLLLPPGTGEGSVLVDGELDLEMEMEMRGRIEAQLRRLKSRQILLSGRASSEGTEDVEL